MKKQSIVNFFNESEALDNVIELKNAAPLSLVKLDSIKDFNAYQLNMLCQTKDRKLLILAVNYYVGEDEKEVCEDVITSLPIYMENAPIYSVMSSSIINTSNTPYYITDLVFNIDCLSQIQLNAVGALSQLNTSVIFKVDTNIYYGLSCINNYIMYGDSDNQQLFDVGVLHAYKDPYPMYTVKDIVGINAVGLCSKADNSVFVSFSIELTDGNILNIFNIFELENKVKIKRNKDEFTRVANAKPEHYVLCSSFKDHIRSTVVMKVENSSIDTTPLLLVFEQKLIDKLDSMINEYNK